MAPAKTSDFGAIGNYGIIDRTILISERLGVPCCDRVSFAYTLSRTIKLTVNIDQTYCCGVLSLVSFLESSSHVLPGM